MILRRASLGVMVLALIASSSGAVEAQLLTVNPLTQGVTVARTVAMDVRSSVNGHRYTIKLAFPTGPAPPRGYGVLYVLDGDEYFASATEIARNYNALSVAIVGIGYPDDAAFVRAVFQSRGPAPGWARDQPPFKQATELERLYDLTMPASELELEKQKVWFPRPHSANVGGVDDFLKTIEVDIKPKVQSLVRIDSSNQALFGDSLGGLTALHALFREPGAFRTFIIGSPSIWWNKKAVLQDEWRFATAVSSRQAAPRVLVSIGSEESDEPAGAPVASNIDLSSLRAAIHEARMVENARELVEQLKSVKGSDAYRVEDLAVFPGFPHSASPWPALARGIRFAFATQ